MAIHGVNDLWVGVDKTGQMLTFALHVDFGLSTGVALMGYQNRYKT
jgi:hypothetical protein